MLFYLIYFYFMHTYLSIYLFNYLFLFSFFISFIDIDECTLQTDDCSANSVCTNVDGSFNCECQPGFTGDGETCNGRLIKNRSLIQHTLKTSLMALMLMHCWSNCLLNSVFFFFTLTNQCILFTYACIYFLYKDIDECALQTHDCSPSGECTNLDGSFNCECQPGFTGDGKTCTGSSRVYIVYLLTICLFLHNNLLS